MGFLSSIFKGLGGLVSTVSGAASLLGAGASLFSGIQQKKQAKKQAEEARRQATLNAKNSRRNTQRLAGQQRANFAAAGLKIEGSPALLIEETENLGAQEVSNILYAGDQQAKAYKRAGRNAVIGGFLSGGSDFLKGLD